MTANTPPPATGRDTGEAVPDFGCPACGVAGGHSPACSAKPPAPQAEASVEALLAPIQALFSPSSSDGWCPRIRSDHAEHVLGYVWAALAEDRAQRDAAVRAEVADRIASAIEAADLPPMMASEYDRIRAAIKACAHIARTTGGDR